MSFPPVYSARAHTLIVGTWPSPKSRAQGFYYGHPQNRFWPLLAHLYKEAPPQSVEEKKALLLRHDLALWDTLAQCSIQGASDASIRDPVPNDLAALCARLPIRRIVCNGAAAFALCQKYHAAQLDLPVHKLPSTSPANAAFRLDALAQAWGAVLCPQ